MIKKALTVLIYLRYWQTAGENTNEKNHGWFFEELLVLSIWSKKPQNDRACGRFENKDKLPSDNLFAMLSYSAQVVKWIVARVSCLPRYLYDVN